MDCPAAAPPTVPARMETLPPVAAGHVRIEVRFASRATPPTPGEVARAAGVPPDELGPILVGGLNAVVDVRSAAADRARRGLDSLGRTRVADWNFRWLKLHVGRNHGLTVGQLRKLLAAIDALPLGRFNINNTHTLVGVLDQKAAAIVERLAQTRVNGQAVRPELVASGKGLGSAAFSPEA